MSRPASMGDNVEMPSLDVVRRLTDGSVLRQLMGTGLLTRSQLAARTGISKPTISESIRRLEEAGRVVAAGRQTGGRGRSGTYYRLTDHLGAALAMHAGPEGVIADVLDLHGTVLHHVAQSIEVPCTPRRLAGAIERVAREAIESVAAPMRAVTMSIADPVNQRTERIVRMPNSPFLVGEVRPYALLGRLGLARDLLLVDNDTNLGAFAEHRAGAGRDLTDFAYLWLGIGIGVGLVVNGAVHRGWSGLAGELWQTVTRGPDGRAAPLNDCFGELGLCPGGGAAIDVDEVNRVLASSGAADRRIRDAIVDSVTTALANVTALINPRAVIVAGPWSDCGDLRERIGERIARSPVPAEVRAPEVIGNPFVVGAQLDALERARQYVLDR